MKIVEILIAVLLAYIAWQNYKINNAVFYVNKDTLRLSLFDRRYKIFEAFKNYFLNFLIVAKTDDKKLSEFILNTSEAEFLFGKEVVEYRDNIIDNSVRLRQIYLKLERQDLEKNELKKLAEEVENIEKWFSRQRGRISEVFRKYLHFSIKSKP